MKKVFFKSLSLVLAAAIVFSSLSLLSASAAQTADCPYIYVHGFMARDIIADKDNRDSDTVWPPPSDDILDVVKQCVPALLRFLVDRNYRALADAIVEPVKGLLSGANLDPSGEVPNSTGVYFRYPDASTITKTSYLDFSYDWRLDPVELAAQLNDFIDYVLACSGSSQVVLECHSFGGIVTEAYVQLYGGEKLRSVCYNTTAIFGESYTGEMMSGNIRIDAESLTEYLKCMLSENEYADLLSDIFDLLRASGVTGDIAELLNGIIDNLGEELIREILLPMFAGWLSIWAMIPDEYFDSAYDFVFNRLYKNDPVDRSGLIEKINGYNTSVRPYKAQVLERQNETTNLYVFSRYGFTSVPLTDKWATMSDTVVDSARSSFGGTFADYGTVFTDAEIAEYKPTGLMNADATVYAGTCMFPQQTWFFKDLMHAKSPDDMEDMAYELLYYPGQADINTFEQYPQFLVYDSADGSITPDAGTPAAEESFWRKLFGFYLKFIAFIRGIFDFVF